MRIFIALPFAALLAGCQVNKDEANDSVSVTYNGDIAENVAADVANTAENIAADIGNDVERTGEKIDNRVGDRDQAGNAVENR
ncbi:MAG TPA: hypothetical protein VM308_04750 [Sphingomicrobium sp.]|nr:hypothetical protein [Sphingomicrobium sp.]